jgi:aryl-alcohol dehydrogenase-like predicted oxidoreductase
MNRIKLKGTDLEISPIGLGCMSLSDDLKEGQKVISKAIEGGINFLDTADLYQNGFNEEIVGHAILGKRSEVVLATKVGNQLAPDGRSLTWNPRKSYIMQAVEGSLKRLKTDYIDLYQLHGGTIEDPFEEILEAFELLRSQGKIRAFGISSIRPNVIGRWVKTNSPATLMLQYNPLDRRPEEEVFDLVAGSTIQVLVRGAFARGVLIDRIGAGFLDFSELEIKAVRNRILSFGLNPEAFLIRFGLSQPSVASLIIGASSSSQIEKIIQGFEESNTVPLTWIDELKAEFSAKKYDLHRS